MKNYERKLKQIINHIHWLFYLSIQTPIPRHGRIRALVRIPRCGLWVGRPEHRHRQSDHLVTNKEENERTLNNTNHSIGDLPVHFSPTQLLGKTVLFWSDVNLIDLLIYLSYISIIELISFDKNL